MEAAGHETQATYRRGRRIRVIRVLRGRGRAAFVLLHTNVLRPLILVAEDVFHCL